MSTQLLKELMNSTFNYALELVRDGEEFDFCYSVLCRDDMLVSLSESPFFQNHLPIHEQMDIALRLLAIAGNAQGIVAVKNTRLFINCPNCDLARNPHDDYDVCPTCGTYLGDASVNAIVASTFVPHKGCIDALVECDSDYPAELVQQQTIPIKFSMVTANYWSLPLTNLMHFCYNFKHLMTCFRRNTSMDAEWIERTQLSAEILEPVHGDPIELRPEFLEVVYNEYGRIIENIQYN